MLLWWRKYRFWAQECEPSGTVVIRIWSTSLYDSNEDMFEFLNRYCSLRRCPDHVFLSYVESDVNFYNYPIHVDDIPRMPESKQIFAEIKKAKQTKGAINAKNLEDYWISSVGATLYEKFIQNYSKKMWQVEDNQLIDDFAWSPKGVALKDGSREAWDTTISVYPYAANGYDDYFELQQLKLLYSKHKN